MPDERPTYQRTDRPQRRVRSERDASSVARDGSGQRRVREPQSPAAARQARAAAGAGASDAASSRAARSARPGTSGAQGARSAQSAQAPQRRELPAYKRQIARWRQYGVYAFAVIMLVGGVLGILFPVRPTMSDFEKRELTKFPEFSIEAFVDGSFFDGLSLWFADTYPLREPLVKFNRSVQSLYGIQTGVQMYGGAVQADELPAADADDGEASEAAPEPRKPVDPPTEQAMQDDIQGNIMNGLYVEGGRACSVYYFSQYAVDTYAQAINAAADRLAGTTDVYSILIPNNSGATLDDDVLAQLGGTNQKEALDYFHSKMDSNVKVVETYDQLRAHRDEYIYFRTDHHWTQLGAFYAFESFCKAKGIAVPDIDAWEQHDYEPFLGSFYQQLWLPAMEENPDTVHVYIPTGTNDMTYWNEYGEEFQGRIIEDGTDYGMESKYMIYIYGDQPLCRIDNPNITDGSTCLIVKDSYGCAFAPLLVDSYQTVYIIDFRYSIESDIPEFCFNHDVDDLIFLNNMTIAGTETVAEQLLSLCS